MKFIDIAFGATLVAFGLGALAGAFVTAFSLTFRDFMLLLINLRIVAPVRAATDLGRLALMLLIFLNNCIPVALSFAYPLIIGKVSWTPPLRASLRNSLLTGFSLLTGSLLGFFNLGATLMLVEKIRGPTLLNALLRTSWVHAPLEFLLVLACVAEPLRLTLRPVNGDEIVRFLRADTKLLFICLIGLLASAAIEVFAAA
jgi:hypothetical protein